MQVRANADAELDRLFGRPDRNTEQGAKMGPNEESEAKLHFSLEDGVYFTGRFEHVSKMPGSRLALYERIADALQAAADGDYINYPLRAVLEALSPERQGVTAGAPMKGYAQLLRQMADIYDPDEPVNWDGPTI